MVQRAAVLVGVRRSGDLPPLPAVDGGIDRMQKLMQDQGIVDVVVLTDTLGGDVEANSIYQAIAELVEKATIEQLIVYYAGHGVNNGYSEYWLLSGAPTNPNEAINVAGSTVLAERAGIPHVVIVSDACRTAPDSIAAQGVTGSMMFPNNPPSPGASASAVDVFYACLLGEPAHEFRDPADASRAFKSVYTEVFLECLRGSHPQVVEKWDDTNTSYELVRPWALKRELPALVTTRIRERGLWATLSQTPDAKITSDPDTAWVSRQEIDDRRRRRRRRSTPVRGPAVPDLATLATREVNLAVHGKPELEQQQQQQRRQQRSTDSLVEGWDALQRATRGLAAEFGPAHYESGAGVKVRGGHVKDAFAVGVDTEVLADDLLRIHGIHEQGSRSNVLIRFDTGACSVIPIVEQYMAAITFDRGSLVDVSYEPMDTNPRWVEFHGRAPEIRRARASMAAATRLGVLRLDRETSLETARHLQLLKGLDPSFALYAAYAYHDLGRRDLIAEMRDYMFGDLGIAFFDVDLLLGREPNTGGGRPTTLPFFPLLSQGWALTRAFGVEVPASVADPAGRLPSLWTLFKPATYDRVRAAMTSREVA